ncbi:hypothetical protein CURTO8I2_220301 [Curtobacterium sp. 8I-2]|nr:hypothetical protein CURTO8I2_220301 [Curtobacterium sp. 8I-2]
MNDTETPPRWVRVGALRTQFVTLADSVPAGRRPLVRWVDASASRERGRVRHGRRCLDDRGGGRRRRGHRRGCGGRSRRRHGGHGCGRHRH